MSSKTSSDDTSKPGFVSAIVMKFTNLSKSSDSVRSLSEQKLMRKPEEINKDVVSRGHRNFQKHDEISSGSDAMATKSVFSKDTLKTTIDNRINAEYEVIGDINVKDRIQAFTSLQQTLKSAAMRPEVLKSSRFASNKAKLPLGKLYEQNLKETTTTSIKKEVTSKPTEPLTNRTVFELISKINRGSSITGSDVRSTPNKRPASYTSSPPPHKPFVDAISSSKECSSSKSSTSNKKSSSSSTNTIPHSMEYVFDTKHKGPVSDIYQVTIPAIEPEDDYTMDSSMIDEIMAKEDDDDDDISPSSVHPHMTVTASKDCLHVDHTNDHRSFIMYEPNKNADYTPWPKSYNPVFDSQGSLKITLPRSPIKSVLKKENGTKPDTKRTIQFDTEKVTVMETYSMYEYERGDDSIDPLTASAEYEIEKKTEELDKFELIITKDEKGLGMSIVGIGLGSDIGSEKLGIYVKALTPGGASEKSKKLCVHDQLLGVDGVSLVGVTQAFAAQTLKATSKIVKFLIGREKNESPHSL